VEDNRGVRPPTDGRQAQPVRRPGAFRVGSLVGVDVYVGTSWLVIAVLFSISLGPNIEQVRPGLGPLKYVAALAFVILFYLSLLLHEISHAVVAQHYGIGVRSITLSFFGGATEIEEEARRPSEEFWIAVVGPITSIMVGLVSLVLLLTHPVGLIELAVYGLAYSNLVVGALNLVPGLPFDGGRVLRSGVWGATKDPVRGTLVAGWSGRVVAVLVFLAPFWLPLVGLQVQTFDFVFYFILAFFLWSAASASVMQARFRSRLPNLQARSLARRTLTLPSDLPVAEAVRRAQEHQAGAIVTLDSAGQPAGIVNEQALLAVPQDRRPWLPVSTISRTMEGGLAFPADLAGEQLLLAMRRTPATEYLLLEPDGSVYGVLVTSDVDRAFAGRA
jgi:Zn-dependent protease